MSQTLQNQIILARSMNSIVELNDGAGTSISNGQVSTTIINSNSITSTNLTLNGILDLNNSLELEQFDNITTPVGSVSLWEKGNAYFTYLPRSLATPSVSSEFITKLFADNTYSTIVGSVTLSGTNIFTGLNLFNTNLPTSTLTPSSNAHLITKLFADTTYASKTGNNNFTGFNAFNVNLPTSTQAPTLNNHLCNRTYVDTKASIAAVINYNATKNIFFGGTNSLTAQIASGGIDMRNICIGNQTMPTAGVSALENICIGDLAGRDISAGIQNVLLGSRAGQYLTNGVENFGLGLQALGSCTTGSYNVGIGVNALLGQNTGQSCVGIGRYALSGNNGNDCTAIGYFCGVQMQNCSQNTLIGAYTMWNYIISPSNCVAIGFAAGQEQNGNGSNNTYIGANSVSVTPRNPTNCTFIGASTDTTGNFSDSTCIGYQSVITGNNQIILGTTNETSFAMGGLTIPSGAKVLSALGYLASTGPGVDAVMNSIKALQVFPPTYNNYLDAIGDMVLAMGQYTCDNLQNPGLNSNVSVIVYGINCLTFKTTNTLSTTVLGQDNLSRHTTANFFNACVIGQSNLNDVGSNYAISNTYVIGSNVTAFNPTGSIFPTSINFCTFINSVGMQLPSSTAVVDTYALHTDQYITGSNQGILGKSNINLTIYGDTKLDSATGLQYGAKYKPNSVFQSIGGTATNWNTTPPTYFPKYVLFSASGAGTVVLTLPLISNSAIYEGFEFIFRRTNTAASATTTSILQVARSGTDTIYGINVMTTATTVNVLASGAYHGKIVCVNKTTTPFNWAYFPS